MKISRTKNYDNMRKYLHRRLKVDSVSAVSYLLIEKFTSAQKPTDWQYICANDLKERGIIPSKSHHTFSSWRDEMVKKGILICMATGQEFKDSTPVYKANMFKYGISIKKYIESELQSSIYERIDEKADEKRVALIENQIENKVDKSEFEELKRKVESMSDLLLHALPPDTPVRRKIIVENIHDKEKCLGLLTENLMKEKAKNKKNGATYL